MAREADAESKRRKFEREKATLERIRRMEQLHEIHMSGISTKGGRRESEATAALMHIGLQKARTNLKRNALQHVRQIVGSREDGEQVRCSGVAPPRPFLDSSPLAPQALQQLEEETSLSSGTDAARALRRASRWSTAGHVIRLGASKTKLEATVEGEGRGEERA